MLNAPAFAELRCRCQRRLVCHLFGFGLVVLRAWAKDDLVWYPVAYRTKRITYHTTNPSAPNSRPFKTLKSKRNVFLGCQKKRNRMIELRLLKKSWYLYGGASVTGNNTTELYCVGDLISTTRQCSTERGLWSLSLLFPPLFRDGFAFLPPLLFYS